MIDRLKGHWMQSGIESRHGVSDQDIESFESRHHVRLPADLRRYFVTIDGMQEGEMDNDCFSFLPLQAVKSIPEEVACFGGIPDYRGIMDSLPDPNRWFVVVDYLICSAVYAVRLSAEPEATSVLWIGDGTRHRIVASSFSDFLEAYLADPLSLL